MESPPVFRGITQPLTSVEVHWRSLGNGLATYRFGAATFHCFTYDTSD